MVDEASSGPAAKPARGTRFVIAILLAGVLVSFGMLMWPPDSDGAFASHDAIFYGVKAERAPRESLVPSHPLFHVLVAGATIFLASGDFSMPGHRAARLVASAGAVALCLLVWAAAGFQISTGLLLVLALGATRVFCMELAAGENVIPAVACALAVLQLASRERPRFLVTGMTLALALMLRQDNVMLVPSVALLLLTSTAVGSPGTELEFAL